MQKLLILFLFLCCYHAYAQKELPIVRANSKPLTIRDGQALIGGVIVPEAKPDIYEVSLPYQEKIVTYITDIDSISFIVKYGEKHDFIILLNGKDSCYNQISANPKHLTYKQKAENTDADTLPFIVKTERIYFTGKVNGVENLLFQLDLGAGATCVNHKSVKKMKLVFDGKTNLINSHGSNETRTSKHNQLEINNLLWENDYLVETRNMESWEDVIVGNSLFLDKIIEIDYNKQIVLIHKQLPDKTSEYTKFDMILDGGVRPMIKASVEIEGKKYTDWYLFDTGHTGELLIPMHLIEKYGIGDKIPTIIGLGKRKIAKLPKFLIGKYEFLKEIVVLQKGELHRFGLIGNKILNKFNIIIDNRAGFMYLKENK